MSDQSKLSKLSQTALRSLAFARSSVYALEAIPVFGLNRIFAQRSEKPIDPDEFKHLTARTLDLFTREARALTEGVYPLSALDATSPWSHARSLAGVLRDGVRIAWRMRNRNHDDFDTHARTHGEDLPKYYTRNFHFQTDGYLSEASAKRYDHQVEILFLGTAAAQRRLILPVLKRVAPAKGRFLELGAGPGSATRGVLATFPKARVTALDLSGPYLKIAQERLRKFHRVDFVQGDATNLNFKDETFDVVYSVYVMHEMPPAEREALVREAYRVLKPGGALVLADSLQMDDDPPSNAALKRFPRVYHEPFFAGYSRDRLEDLVHRVTGQTAEGDHALFTKVVWAIKPA